MKIEFASITGYWIPCLVPSLPVSGELLSAPG
jgi:hypothetical protein